MIHRGIGKVISNGEISEGIFQTSFYVPIISVNSHPGQFINILPTPDWRQVMRRPMSIASQGNDEISIIYKAIGEGTHIMAAWKIGTEVDLIGPLGNYWTEYNTTKPILIGGGLVLLPY